MRAIASVLTAVVAVGVAAAQSPPPLPVPEHLYEVVRENLVRAERVAHLYAFKERRTDIHTNPFGRLGTDGSRVLEVYPSSIRSLTFRRLVEEDGVPLSAARLAEQDRQYRARVAAFQRRSGVKSAEERRLAEVDAARVRERRQRRVEDVVNALQFTLEGRTVHNGVPALVVAFVPRQGARPETREGRMAVSFTGKVFIDEAASEVMHVEAASIDDISYGFGLVARVQEGAKASMTRRPIDGNIWMPTRITLQGRGRAVLVRPLQIDFAVEWFDYRRLEGDSVTPFLDLRVEREPGGGPQ